MVADIDYNGRVALLILDHSAVVHVLDRVIHIFLHNNKYDSMFYTTCCDVECAKATCIYSTKERNTSKEKLKHYML
jgi:hypothetical protein